MGGTFEAQLDSMKKNKVFVIGLDCAEPSLVFERWRDKLPNFRKMCSSGVYGKMKSTIPPITVPAWSCMLKEIYQMTENRFKMIKYYLANREWDFFMFVEMGVDRIHHAFWRFHDPGHRLYEPGTSKI